MKTIAISIDTPTLEAIDRIARALAKHPGRGERGKRAMNRSLVVRAALKRYVDDHERQGRETDERRILSAHRARLERQLHALVAEQAEP